MRKGLSGSLEQGQSAVEHLGVLAIASVVVAALVLSPIGSELRARGQELICRIVTPPHETAACGAAPAPDTPAADPFVPTDPCVLASQESRTTIAFNVRYIRLGTDHGFLREELSDGSVRLTHVDDLYGGGTYELGRQPGIEWSTWQNRGGATARGDLVGGLRLGDIRTFENRSAADEFVSARAREKWEVIGEALGRDRTAAELPAPDSTLWAVRGEASALGRTGTGTTGAEVGGAAEGLRAVERASDGARTEYFQVALGGDADFQVLLFGLGGGGSSASVVKLERDESGVARTLILEESVEVSVQALVSLDGLAPEQAAQVLREAGTSGQATDASRTVVTQTTLRLTNDEERALAVQWLSLSTAARGATPSVDVSEELRAELLQRGQVGVYTYEGDATSFGGSALLELVGASTPVEPEFDLERSLSRLVDAQYLQAPQSGARVFAEVPGCQP